MSWDHLEADVAAEFAPLGCVTDSFDLAHEDLWRKRQRALWQGLFALRGNLMHEVQRDREKDRLHRIYLSRE